MDLAKRERLINLMKDYNLGIPIRDQRIFFSVYKQSFAGKESGIEISSIIR